MAGGDSVPAAHRAADESADLATRLYEDSMDYAEAKPGHQAGLVNSAR